MVNMAKLSICELYTGTDVGMAQNITLIVYIDTVNMIFDLELLLRESSEM